MTAYQASRHIGYAIASALQQTETDLEVVVSVDDACTDGTARIVAAIADRDSRLRMTTVNHERRVGGGRNAALDLCRGEWVTMLDADDAFAPTRLSVLHRAALEAGAEMVADNLMLVSHPDQRPIGRAMLPADHLATGRLTSEAFVAGNGFTSGRHTYGYLKPLIRREFLLRHQIRYPENLNVCEDYHFLFDCLAAGADWRLIEPALYLYSLRPGSLSRGIAVEDVDEILQHGREQLAQSPASAEMDRLMQNRLADIERFRAYLVFRTALRHHDFRSALDQFLVRPALVQVGLNGIKRRLVTWASAQADVGHGAS